MKKSDVSLNDLSSLTAATGNEFDIFTLGSRRFVFRGFSNILGVSEGKIFELGLMGVRFSEQTHLGISRTGLKASSGDRQALALFVEMATQRKSIVQNSLGEFREFSENLFDDFFSL